MCYTELTLETPYREVRACTLTNLLSRQPQHSHWIAFPAASADMAAGDFTSQRSRALPRSGSGVFSMICICSELMFVFVLLYTPLGFQCSLRSSDWFFSAKPRDSSCLCSLVFWFPFALFTLLLDLLWHTCLLPFWPVPVDSDFWNALWTVGLIVNEILPASTSACYLILWHLCFVSWNVLPLTIV